MSDAIIPSYRDAWGEERQVPEATRRAIRAAMGGPPPRRPLPPVLVTRRDGAPVALRLHAPDSAWRLELEDGGRREGRAADGVVTLPGDLPLGYHALHACDCAMTLIVAPRRGYLPDGARRWGLSVQLYGACSPRSWGIGDFSDLARLARAAAELGADMVGVNPLHALFPDDPRRFGPYSPSDRRFLSMAYIDVEAVEGFEPAMRPNLDEARAAPLVDYAAVIPAKLHVLDRLYGAFRAAGASNGFRRFQAERGAALRRFATFQALSEHFEPGRGWRDWPDAYQDANSPDVAAFAARESARVEFFEYLQWQADRQLKAAARAASDAGMAIGLYQDLALGADPDGAEAWANRRLMAEGVRVGAPPDDWNLKGQNWGLPAYNPIALREAAYAPFVEMLRAAMRHAGAVRIDHVMSLERLYWIPEETSAADGGYVRYPVDDLIGILTLESLRNGCIVIGEDLGTLPDGFQDRMREADILSSRLLYFALDDGAFLPPERFVEPALVEITTHDLATLPGYWAAHDLDLRHALDLFPSAESEAESRRRRDHDRRALVRALKREGLLPVETPEDGGTFGETLALAAYRYLARTPARLLQAHPEDVLGVIEQANLPGTTTEHPNWRRKLPLDIDALIADPRLRALAAAIAAERRAR